MKDMKTIVTHLCIIIVTLLSLSGCSDFLDEKPQGNTGTTGNFYKNKEDIEYALTAAYANLQTSAMYQNNMVLMTDVRLLIPEEMPGGNTALKYLLRSLTIRFFVMYGKKLTKRYIVAIMSFFILM